MMLIGLGLTLAYAQAFAGTSTATATVTATVPSVTTVSLARDTGSATRGSASTIIFDKLDSQDTPGGDAGLMYAPYRTTENGKNWHFAKVAANGSTLTLALTVSGTVGGQPLSNLLKVYCGGFYLTGSTTFISGTNSADWEFASGWQRTLTQAFIGTVPFNYQLNVSAVGAGSYSGSVTFTLTTT
ncbi:MAG TPA: hypothetical protein VMD52_06625 [Patescibacteria group bacterium]|nr:hypothetical protein [Patescibacteria group bacterium]